MSEMQGTSASEYICPNGVRYNVVDNLHKELFEEIKHFKFLLKRKTERINELEAKLKESEDKNNKTYNQAINDALEIIADSSESGCYDVVDRLLKESENE